MIGKIVGWLLGTSTGQWLLAGAAFLAGLLGWHWSAKNAGRAEERADQAERTLDNVEKANEARRDADAANRAGAPDERVRKFYTD